MESKIQNNDIKKFNKTISGKLLRRILPLIIFSIAIVIIFLIFNARTIILSSAENGLKQETASNANSVGCDISNFLGEANSMALTLENREFQDDDDLFSFLENSKQFNTDAPNGIYLGLSNGQLIDLSGWVPTDDYVVTERGWYTEGLKHETFTTGEPYLDLVTGKLVVPISRAITLKDGRDGVAAADFFLSSITEKTNALKPMGKGSSLLLSDDMIIAYSNEKFNGTSVKDHSDDLLLTHIYSKLQSNPSKVLKLEGNGKSFYVDYEKVPGTNWTLISYVDEDDVLADLNRFMIICSCAAIIMIIIITIVMLLTMSSVVSKPVKNLTNVIIGITNKDFTIDIPDRNNDEIGEMNHNMRKFISNMHITLSTMKEVSDQLSYEADTSKDESSTMYNEAKEQSDSMNVLKGTVEGMAQAVSELSNDATSLADKVGTLTAQGTETNTVMKELVDIANQGKNDMRSVTENMDSISKSMSDVNSAVEHVDESAKQINNIIEMINSIASQTNLLSLNASIEAARAGEAGKGFAVVADEIGKLANDSADATTEIASIIGDIAEQITSLAKKSTENVDAIKRSTESVETAEKTFEKIFTNLGVTGDTVQEMITDMNAVNEIATSLASIAEEQAASSEEISASLDKLTSSAENVSSSSLKIKESSVGVSNGADTINESVNTFKL